MLGTMGAVILQAGTRNRGKLIDIAAAGPLAGTSLRDLVSHFGEDLVGAGFRGKTFPLMVKLIDAAQRLSVQVHPDDATAARLGAGDNGKTECWLLLEDGGEIYQGTRPGIDRLAFERALAQDRVAETLNRFEARAGDFFFLPGRTVHALGAGCLLYEIQQTSDVTFRVHDWGRLGLDGNPRPLHVALSLETIDFSRTDFGPQRPPWQTDAPGGETRRLVDCAYFTVTEQRSGGAPLRGEPTGRCAVVTCLEGEGELETAGGSVVLSATATALVPAAAGAWSLSPRAPAVRVLVSEPGV
jgi:mannose-6-phosphate isomerase